MMICLILRYAIVVFSIPLLTNAKKNKFFRNEYESQIPLFNDLSFLCFLYI